jgi:uncharacterized protein (TIGR02265 family)
VSVPLEQRVVFKHTVEGLFFQALKGKVSARIKQRVRDEAKIDLDKIEPAVPLTRWNRSFEICAEELFPGERAEVALERMGRMMTHGYFETFLGRAVAGVLKVIGPARALKRLDRSFRSGNNYSEVKVTELAPTHYRFWCNDVGMARHVVLGVVSGGGEVAGAKNLRGEVTHHDEQGCTIELKWD